MKKLVIITGPPGIGKTTICEELFNTHDRCAWLDADWCWKINPWINKTKEQKQYVAGTFERIIRGYLENKNTDIVLFDWVIRTDWMFDLITDPLKDLDMDVYKIALVCDSHEHMQRMRTDNRNIEKIDAEYNMKEFCNIGAQVVDVSHKSVKETANLIKNIIK